MLMQSRHFPPNPCRHTPADAVSQQRESYLSADDNQNSNLTILTTPFSDQTH